MTTTALVPPELRRTPHGWLAVSAPGDYPRIGVMGQTEDEARQTFHEAQRRWLELRELPAPGATGETEKD